MNICPNCLKSVDLVPLVDIVISFKAGEATNELIELHWHKNCYPNAAADLLAALRPFAGLWRAAMNNMPDDKPIYQLNDAIITAGNVKAALAAIAKAEGGEG